MGEERLERFSNISMAVVRRLPKYHRYLKELMSNGVKRISSQELSNITGFTASQIRQDLNCFGGFGQQGYGYNVTDLYAEITRILGLDKTYRTVIVGAGNVGRAIANYTFFRDSGFELQGIFDVDPTVIGEDLLGHTILSLENIELFMKEGQTDIGIICTPKDQSQLVADKMVLCGIKAIWNFAPIDLRVPNDVIVENVHLSESLFTISYLLKEAEESERSR